MLATPIPAAQRPVRIPLVFSRVAVLLAAGMWAMSDELSLPCW